MENAQKAIIMAGSVFMFVIAVSIAIYSYNTVIYVVESILTASEQYDQNVEGYGVVEDDVERYATQAEVVMTILSMQDADYTASKIIVKRSNGSELEFTKGTGAELDDNLYKIEDGSYSVNSTSTVEDGPVIEFKKI